MLKNLPANCSSRLSLKRGFSFSTTVFFHSFFFEGWWVGSETEAMWALPMSTHCKHSRHAHSLWLQATTADCTLVELFYTDACCHGCISFPVQPGTLNLWSPNLTCGREHSNRGSHSQQSNPSQLLMYWATHAHSPCLWQRSKSHQMAYYSRCQAPRSSSCMYTSSSQQRVQSPFSCALTIHTCIFQHPWGLTAFNTGHTVA